MPLHKFASAGAPLCLTLLISRWLRMKGDEPPGTSRQMAAVYPLCLAVSDGGEKRGGGCSVSVRGRSLQPLFRSTHAYAGESSGFPLQCPWPFQCSPTLTSLCLCHCLFVFAPCSKVVLSDVQYLDWVMSIVCFLFHFLRTNLCVTTVEKTE